MILLLLSLAFAGEHNIAPSALPSAVTAAVQTRLPGAVIVSAEKEGRAFETRVTLGERHLELVFSADGTWLEEEERVSSETLPAAVLATVDARWKGWTLVNAERELSPKGTVYVVKLRNGAEQVEAELTEAGVVTEVERARGHEGQDEGHDDGEDGDEPEDDD